MSGNSRVESGKGKNGEDKAGLENKSGRQVGESEGQGVNKDHSRAKEYSTPNRSGGNDKEKVGRVQNLN